MNFTLPIMSRFVGITLESAKPVRTTSFFGVEREFLIEGGDAENGWPTNGKSLSSRPPGAAASNALMKRNANGEFSLRGENLTLDGVVLDRTFSRYEASQRFNLVDGGAFFFAGPFGPLISKG